MTKQIRDCTKIGFFTMEAARTTAVKIEQRRGNKSKGFNKPYKCTHCNLFHLTSKKW
jgi:hypothetical protein